MILKKYSIFSMAIILIFASFGFSEKASAAFFYPSNGAEFQQALDDANLGDEIVLTAGTTYIGDFVLPYKSTGSGYVTIRSSMLDQMPEGKRVTPADANKMPKIRAANIYSAAISTGISGGNPAHHYKLLGLEVVRLPGAGLNYNLIDLSTEDTTSLSEVPHDIIIDRSYVHGLDGAMTRRGLFLNSKDTEITNSYFSKFFDDGADSQAILGIGGPGGYLISNNYLEAAGENIMFGGGDPSIINLVPSDIVIENNHIFKPLSWKGNEPGVVKNLLELKNAKNVIIRNNILENNWPAGQGGTAVLFTVRNQDGTAPWSTVEDVLFEYNIIKNVPSAVTILVSDDESNSQSEKNITIRNNFIQFDPTHNGNDRTFAIMTGQLNGDPGENIIIEHNTSIRYGSAGEYYTPYIYFGDEAGGFLDGIDINNNIEAMTSPLTIWAGLLWVGQVDGVAPEDGIDTLNHVAYNNNWSYSKNVITTGGNSIDYPLTSSYVNDIEAVGFEDVGNEIFKLANNSPFKGDSTTPGTDPGVNWDELMSRTENVVSGDYSENPPQDTTPPSVSITAPSASTTVSGSTVTVSANASDNVGVAGVQFQLNGSNLGAEDTQAPYSIVWDTTQVTNGSYTLTAIARDAAHNTTTSSSVNVNVNNVTPPSSGGGGGGGGSRNTSPTVPTSNASSRLINSNGTYYLIQNGQKKGVTSPGILNSCGFEFKDAMQATAADSSLPINSLLLPCGGSLVKSYEDPTVYLVSNGKRYAFTSASVFAGMGYKFSSVLIVTNPELQALQRGVDLTNPDLAHLPQTNININGTIYWIDLTGKKQPYPSLEVYNSWNVDNDFSNVVPANSADLALPTGGSVIPRM